MTIILTHTWMIIIRSMDKNKNRSFGELPREKRTGQASERINQIINR